MYSKNEKKSWFKGFKYGLFKNSKNDKIRSKPAKIKNNREKQFKFGAFNDNCDCFNVVSYGKTRMEAKNNIQKTLCNKSYPGRGKIHIDGKANKDCITMFYVDPDGRIHQHGDY
ncbi:MAG: hypothetical protein WCR97_03900 [Bacilli bacterium]